MYTELTIYIKFCHDARDVTLKFYPRRAHKSYASKKNRRLSPDFYAIVDYCFRRLHR